MCRLAWSGGEWEEERGVMDQALRWLSEHHQVYSFVVSLF